MAIVACNLGKSVIKRYTVLRELRFLSVGQMVAVLVYCCIWILAPLSYIRMPYLGIANMFNLFQVTN